MKTNMTTIGLALSLIRHTILTNAAMLGLFFVLAVASAHAQPTNQIRANIPFDFVAGDAKLKAGVYTIERRDMNQIVFTRDDSKRQTFALAPESIERARSRAQEKLVFHRYGDIYFLAEVWVSRYADGNGLYTSSAERRVARELAVSKAKPETTEILAGRR